MVKMAKKFPQLNADINILIVGYFFYLDSEDESIPYNDKSLESTEGGIQKIRDDSDKNY